jgi:hypothetical protein
MVMMLMKHFLHRGPLNEGSLGGLGKIPGRQQRLDSLDRFDS